MKVKLFKATLLGIEFLSWLSSVNVESCSLAGGSPEKDTPRKANFRRARPGAVPAGYAEAMKKTSTTLYPLMEATTSRADAQNMKFTLPNKTTTTPAPITKYRLDFEEDCDSIAYYCMKVYNTGVLCARSLNSTYTSFKNYCMLDYVNCMERYEMWQLMHMGDCFTLKMLDYYIHYRYENDYWLDQEYVADE